MKEVRTVFSMPEFDAETFARMARSQQRWLEQATFDVGPGRPPPADLAYAHRPLLDHQRTAVEQLRQWWASDEPAGVLCLPTGAGKTRTAVGFALSEALRSGPVLWLAHRDELLVQALAAFLQNAGSDAHGPFRVGRFDATHKLSAPADVVVASIPSLTPKSCAGLARLLEVERRPFALVVVDECHHGVARTWKGLIEKIRARGTRVLGLSATPMRTSEKERGALWKLFGRVVHEAKPIEMIERGILARPHVHLVATRRRYEATAAERKAFTTFHDLPASLVERVARDARRNELVAQSYLARAGEWGRTLVFAATIEQAQQLTARLHAADVPAECVFGNTPEAKRRQILEDFRDERLLVVVNVTVLSEGTDVPGVQSVFVARPTQSPVLFQQMVGRAMRGRAVGGVADANIVVFHDELVGLAHDQLTVSFSDESAVRAAIGVAETARPRPSARAAQPPRASSAGLLEKLASAWAASGELQADARVSDLLGWWQVATGEECWFLPVTTRDAEAIGAWMPMVTDVVTGQKRAAPPPPPALSKAQAHAARRLAAAAVHHLVAPWFTDARQVDERELQTVTTIVCGGRAEPAPWRSLARRIVAAAGTPPSETIVSTPQLHDLVGELASIDTGERDEAVALYREAFFATQFRTSTDMLYALLAASLGTTPPP